MNRYLVRIILITCIAKNIYSQNMSIQFDNAFTQKNYNIMDSCIKEEINEFKKPFNVGTYRMYIYDAIKNEDSQMVEYLVKKGIPTVYDNGDGTDFTVIDMAIEKYNIVMLKHLLKLGVQLKKINCNYIIPFWSLSQIDPQKAIDYMNILILYGLDINEAPMYVMMGNNNVQNNSNSIFPSFIFYDLEIKNLEGFKICFSFILKKLKDPNILFIGYSGPWFKDEDTRNINIYTIKDLIGNKSNEIDQIMTEYNVKSAAELMIINSDSILKCLGAKAFITNDNVRLRSSPEIIPSNLIKYLGKGKIIKVIYKKNNTETINGIRGYWYFAVIDNSESGWIWGQYINIIKELIY